MIHSSTTKTRIYRGLDAPYFTMRWEFSKYVAVRHPAALDGALAGIRGIGLDALVDHVPPARFLSAPAVGLLDGRATAIASAGTDRSGAALKYTRCFSGLSLHLALHLLGRARCCGSRPRLGGIHSELLIRRRLERRCVHGTALVACARRRLVLAVPVALAAPVALALALRGFRLEGRRLLLWRLRVKRRAGETEQERGQGELHVRSAPACGSAARSSGCRRR